MATLSTEIPDTSSKTWTRGRVLTVLLATAFALILAKGVGILPDWLNRIPETMIPPTAQVLDTVFSFVPKMSQCSGGAIAASSTSTAVATSPKMKWLSRSRQFKWPDVISGLTTSTLLAFPARM